MNSIQLVEMKKRQNQLIDCNNPKIVIRVRSERRKSNKGKTPRKKFEKRLAFKAILR